MQIDIKSGSLRKLNVKSKALAEGKSKSTHQIIVATRHMWQEGSDSHPGECETG